MWPQPSEQAVSKRRQLPGRAAPEARGGAVRCHRMAGQSLFLVQTGVAARKRLQAAELNVQDTAQGAELLEGESPLALRCRFALAWWRTAGCSENSRWLVRSWRT